MDARVRLQLLPYKIQAAKILSLLLLLLQLQLQLQLQLHLQLRRTTTTLLPTRMQLI